MSRSAVVPVVVLSCLCARAGVANELPTPTNPESGGLQRVAATLESTLDAYRLALVELVPAVTSVVRAGDPMTATPTAEVPNAAHQVFVRLAKSLPARVVDLALPAVSRAYHAEAMAALESLSAAAHLEDVREPLGHFVHAVGQIAASGDSILDLFSRRRVSTTQVVDSSTILDGISEALDELGRTEAAIGRLQTKKASQGEQLQGFMRLELALRHALDLIATAEEVGVHIGFDVQLATAGFGKTLMSVHSQLDALRKLVEEMSRKPAVSVSGLVVRFSQVGDADVAQLRWRALEGEAQPAALRITRRMDLEELRSAVRWTQLCRGASEDDAVEAASAPLADNETRVADIAPGRNTFEEKLNSKDARSAWVYEVAALSAFGVSGTPVAATGVDGVSALRAVEWVGARMHAERPGDAGFYQHGDQVEISFTPSASALELPVDLVAEEKEWLAQQGRSFVAGYDVIRQSPEGTKTLARLDALASRYFDSPSWSELAQGISYQVVAVGADGSSAAQSAPCLSAFVQTDVAKAFAWAKMGAGYVASLDLLTTMAREATESKETWKVALTQFAARPAAERYDILRGFWLSLSQSERRALLAQFPAHVPLAEREAWYAQGYEYLRERDLLPIVSELWLRTQPAYVQAAVDRWWLLLDPATRFAALQQWRDAQDPGLVKELKANVDASADVPEVKLARVRAWALGRDVAEREHVLDWWRELPVAEKAVAYSAWLKDQPDMWKQTWRWPDLSRLNDAERSSLENGGYLQLPSGLWPLVMAWVKWQESSPEALAGVVAAHAKWHQRWGSYFWYSVRPVDKALGFHGRAVFLGLLVVGVFVVWRRRR